MSLFARNALEVALRTLRLAEQQRDGYAFIGSRGFDISELPILELKAYAGDRNVDDVDQGMIHCTGVTAGYGVQYWGPTGTRHWRKVIQAGQLPPHFYEQLDHVGLLRAPLDDLVHFVALCSRFRNTPYHIIGTRSGYLLRNRKPQQVTWHGNGTRRSGGNAGIGIAFDASPSSTLTDFHITTFRAALRLGHLVWLDEQTEERPRLRIVTHAQSKYPGRANDPGGGKADMFRRAVIPEVEQLRAEGHDVVIDSEWRWDTGRPLPAWGRTTA